MNEKQVAKRRRYKPFKRVTSWAKLMATSAVFKGACEDNESALKVEDKKLTDAETLEWANRQIEYYELTEGDNE